MKELTCAGLPLDSERRDAMVDESSASVISVLVVRREARERWVSSADAAMISSRGVWTNEAGDVEREAN